MQRHDDSAALLPLARGLALLAGLLAAGCSGNPFGDTAPATPAVTAPAAPPVNMAGRWRLVSANGGACSMTFTAPGGAGGNDRSRGRLPGQFLHQPALGVRTRIAGDPGSQPQAAGGDEAECSRPLRRRAGQRRSRSGSSADAQLDLALVTGGGKAVVGPLRRIDAGACGSSPPTLRPAAAGRTWPHPPLCAHDCDRTSIRTAATRDRAARRR